MKKLTHSLVVAAAVLFACTSSLADHCSGNTLSAALKFLDVVRSVQAAVESRPLLDSMVFETQKLTQAAERFPRVVIANPDFFTLERKFSRISQLTFAVRNTLADSIFLEGDDSDTTEIETIIDRLEEAYLELASALYDVDGQ